MTSTRRELMGAIAAGLLLTLGRQGEAQALTRRVAHGASPLAASPIDPLFEADAEPTPPGFRAPNVVPRWASLAAPPQPAWPERMYSVDFRHIAAVAATPHVAPFRLTSAVLHELAVLNAFDLSRTGERILFGLRGCVPVGRPAASFTRAVELAESTPDHLGLHCVLGVWRPNTRDLWVTRGSTVPNVDFMYQTVHGGKMSNLLPTGLHRYQVGTHRPGSSYPQDGAFKQMDPVPVLRSRNDLSFELPPRDRYDTAFNLIVADNIHAGVLEGASRAPYFSSAGCQVIPGGYLSDKSRAPYGAWAAFRERAGLTPIRTSGRTRDRHRDDGRVFLYMLLTGAEARLVASGDSLRLGSRLRFGSSGPLAARLRRHFNIDVEGDSIDQDTMTALLEWQMRERGYSDGIVDTDSFKAIGA